MLSSSEITKRGQGTLQRVEGIQSTPARVNNVNEVPLQENNIKSVGARESREGERETEGGGIER